MRKMSDEQYIDRAIQISTKRRNEFWFCISYSLVDKCGNRKFMCENKNRYSFKNV